MAVGGNYLPKLFSKTSTSSPLEYRHEVIPDTQWRVKSNKNTKVIIFYFNIYSFF